MPETRPNIRRATPADAAVLADLMNALNEHEGLSAIYSEETVQRDGFGPEPAFQSLLAELANRPVGYAIYHSAYDSERGGRSLWLVDLYVAPEARGSGLGKALMAKVAQSAVTQGCVSLWWGVRSCNSKARAFYAGLGALDDDARILELAGRELAELAESAVLDGP